MIAEPLVANAAADQRDLVRRRVEAFQDLIAVGPVTVDGLETALPDPAALAGDLVEPAAEPVPAAAVGLEQQETDPEPQVLGPTGAPAGEVGLIRPDPLELPLDQTEPWQELLVSVSLNGEHVSGGTLVLRSKDGALAFGLTDLRRWRVRVEEGWVETFAGEPFVQTDRITGGSAIFDPEMLHVDFAIPAGQFEPMTIGRRDTGDLAPSSNVGAFVDYDFQALIADKLDDSLDGLIEIGGFAPFGTLSSSARLLDLATDDREFIRLETTFSRDFPERRARLRIGDTLEPGGTLSPGYRFGGIQFRRDFSTDPSFVTFPQPGLGGLAEQDSVVDVFVNNVQRLSEQVPTGPFSIDNVPVITGAGEVQLRVTDLLGRERLITQSYYVSPRLLREGLDDYSVGAGVLRQDFGFDSGHYDNAFVAGTYRLGLTDALTGGATLELSESGQSIGGEATFLLGGAGLMSAAALLGHEEGEDPGLLGILEYEYRRGTWSVGARTQLAQASAFRLGDGPDFSPPRRRDQLSLTTGLGDFGRLGLFFVNDDGRDTVDTRSLAANYAVPMGPGTFSVNALQSVEPASEFAITLNYTVLLGPDRYVSSSVGHRRDGTRARLQYAQGPGGNELGTRFRAITEMGRDPFMADLELVHQAPFGSAGIEAKHADDQNALRLNLAGSVAAVGGKVRASRRLGRAFALVQAPGFADLPVYLDNRPVGRTSSDGSLLVPNLRPYSSNKLRIETSDLPLDAVVESREVEAVPFADSGIVVPFAIERRQRVTVRLLDRDGQPLPSGTRLRTSDGAVRARVGLDGLTYMEAVTNEPSLELEGVIADQPVFCRVPLTSPGLLLELGEVSCLPFVS